nr:NAD(P)H-hydrate dehydratase [uncultured Deefgea sp.]
MIKTYPVPDPAIALRSLIRKVDSYKGLYGNVAVIGGANSMIGAALLAGRAALKHGTGKVSIGLLNDNFQVDPEQPELMVYKSKRLIKNKSLTHILLGPQSYQLKRCLFFQSPSGMMQKQT